MAGILCELATVKRELGIEEGDAAKDDQLNEYIVEASEEFETDCGQPIERVTNYVHYFTGSNTAREVLEFRKVNALVKLEDYTGVSGGWREIPTAQRTLVQSGMFAVIECMSPLYSFKEYRATLDIGYNDIPSEIRAAVRGRVHMKYNEQNKSFGVADVANAGGSSSSTLTIDFGRHFGTWSRAVRKYRVVLGG